MNATIQDFIRSLQIDTISDERKIVLEPFVAYLTQKQRNGEQIKLNFICTHNSRRSQFAQVWAHTIAAYYEIPILSYSGGVEITACNERTIASLMRAGFVVHQDGQINPRYTLNYGGTTDITLYSKLFDDPINPTRNFAALMTCSDADENCPFISGCEKRIPLTYEDPKKYDNSELEEKMYDQRSKQIATELKYIIHNTLVS
jgi:arsenate reductase